LDIEKGTEKRGKKRGKGRMPRQTSLGDRQGTEKRRIVEGCWIAFAEAVRQLGVPTWAVPKIIRRRDNYPIQSTIYYHAGSRLNP